MPPKRTTSALSSAGAAVLTSNPKASAHPKAAAAAGRPPANVRRTDSLSGRESRPSPVPTPAAPVVSSRPASSAGARQISSRPASAAGARQLPSSAPGPSSAADQKLGQRPTSVSGQRPAAAPKAQAARIVADGSAAHQGVATNASNMQGKFAPVLPSDTALDSISKADLTELKALPTPPESVKQVMEAVGSLLGCASFHDVRKALASPSFLSNLRSVSRQLCAGTLPSSRVDRARELVKNSASEFSNGRRKLKGEVGLYKWVTAVLAEYDGGSSSMTGSRPIPAQPDLVRSESLGHPLSGVSVHHWSTSLLSKMEAAGLEDSATVYEVEPIVIRPTGADIVCPRDEKMGAAYVDSFTNPDDVGIASFMLSYSWGYRVCDISNTLVHHCKDHDLDIKRTYVWVCCLCINQHRVQEKTAKGQQVPFEEFRLAFKERVERIGHVVAMMAPWRAPLYISRVWCDFELYTATAQGIKVTISMPPEEATDFMSSLQTGLGIDEMWKVLTNLKVENANASVPEDKESILRLIKEDIGFDKFDSSVAKYLQTWITTVSESQLKSAMQGDVDISTKAIVTLCARVGDLVRKVGQYQRAIGIYEQGRGCLKKYDGDDKDQWENIFLDNISIAKRCLGDLDGAELAHAESKRYMQAVASSTKTNNEQASLTTAGNLKMQRRDLKGALEDFDRALSLAGESGSRDDSFSRGNVLLNVGSAKAQLGDLDGSLEAYATARGIFKESEQLDTPTGALLMSNLGNVRRMRKEFKTALEVYADAQRIFEKTGTLDTPNGANLLVNVALLKGETGDCQSAIEIAETARDTFEKLGMQGTQACQQAVMIIGFAKKQMEAQAKPC